jgi:hypothetical protein
LLGEEMGDGYIYRYIALFFPSIFSFVLHRYEREKDNVLGEEMADEEIRDVLAGLVSLFCLI